MQIGIVWRLSVQLFIRNNSANMWPSRGTFSSYASIIIDIRSAVRLASSLSEEFTIESGVKQIGSLQLRNRPSVVSI